MIVAENNYSNKCLMKKSFQTVRFLVTKYNNITSKKIVCYKITFPIPYINDT